MGVWRVTVPRPSWVDSIGLYPVAGGSAGYIPLSEDTMYLLRVCPEPYPARFDRTRLPEMLRDRLAPFGGVIAEIRDRIRDDDDVVYGPVHEVKMPPPWNKGRVVICGDAAHACTPHRTEGAGMAFEDAVVLAEELSVDRPVPASLAAFGERRYPRVKFVQEALARPAGQRVGAHRGDPGRRVRVPAGEPGAAVGAGRRRARRDAVTMAELEYTIDGSVGVILLNRPDRKNALTPGMVGDWARVVLEARTDERVRALVVTGAGDAFCSGVDLDAFGGAGNGPLDRKRQLTDEVHQVALALDQLDKPTIAAVNGAAVGAGLDMALMCDMRIVGRSARLSEGYVRVGLVPGDGGCYFLPRLVGMAKALELLLTGDFIDGEEAARIGLANHAVDDCAVLEEAIELARRIAALPPIAVTMIKRATYQSARSDLRTALDLISSHVGIVTATEDSAEAMAAFREKRRGVYHGR